MLVKDIITQLQERYTPDTELCVITWCIEDVLSQANDDGHTITEDQAAAVLVAMEDGHDACVGINWDTISYHISKVVNPEEEEETL